jgi:hypothetical protein
MGDMDGVDDAILDTDFEPLKEDSSVETAQQSQAANTVPMLDPDLSARIEQTRQLIKRSREVLDQHLSAMALSMSRT